MGPCTAPVLGHRDGSREWFNCPACGPRGKSKPMTTAAVVPPPTTTRRPAPQHADAEEMAALVTEVFGEQFDRIVDDRVEHLPYQKGSHVASRRHIIASVKDDPNTFGVLRIDYGTTDRSHLELGGGAYIYACSDKNRPDETVIGSPPRQYFSVEVYVEDMIEPDDDPTPMSIMRPDVWLTMQRAVEGIDTQQVLSDPDVGEFWSDGRDIRDETLYEDLGWRRWCAKHGIHPSNEEAIEAILEMGYQVSPDDPQQPTPDEVALVLALHENP